MFRDSSSWLRCHSKAGWSVAGLTVTAYILARVHENLASATEAMETIVAPRAPCRNVRQIQNCRPIRLYHRRWHRTHGKQVDAKSNSLAGARVVGVGAGRAGRVSDDGSGRYDGAGAGAAKTGGDARIHAGPGSG